MTVLLVLRLQLRLNGSERSTMLRLHVSTIIGTQPAAVLRQLVNVASMPR
jgi:hypothetical protein